MYTVKILPMFKTLIFFTFLFKQFALYLCINSINIKIWLFKKIIICVRCKYLTALIFILSALLIKPVSLFSIYFTFRR